MFANFAFHKNTKNGKVQNACTRHLCYTAKIVQGYKDENDRNIANIGRIFEFQDAVDSCGHFTCDTITKHTNLDHFA